MSVGVVVIPYVMPFKGNIEKQRNPIGRWFSYGNIAGDASGGVMQINHDIAQSAGVLGNDLFYDLRFINGILDVAVAAGNMLLTINASEPLHGSNIWGFTALLTHTTSIAGGFQFLYASQSIAIPRMIFPIGRGNSITGVQLTHYTNAAGQGFGSYAAGFIYDERWLEGRDIN